MVASKEDGGMYNWAVSITFLAGLALRLLNLEGKSLWFDEAHAFFVANAGVEAFWQRGIEPFHPPLFFHFLQIWSAYGIDEGYLRVMPAIFTAVGVIPLYVIGRRIFNLQVGLSAALLFALNPLVLWYSQELRMYAQFLCFGLLSTACLVTIVTSNESKLKDWSVLLFVLSTIGLLYSHYGALLFVYGQLLLLLICWGFGFARFQHVWIWIFGSTISIALYLPWINSGPGSQFYSRFFSGDSISYFTPVGSEITDNLLLLRLGGALVIAISVAFISRIRRVQKWLKGVFQANWFRTSLLIFLVAFLLISVLPRGYTLKRHLLIYVPFLLLFVGVVWPANKQNRVTLAILCLVSLTASLWNIYLIPKTEWEQISMQIVQGYADGDQVVINPGHMHFAFDYYNAKRTPAFNPRGEEFDENLARTRDDNGRIWYVAQPTDQNHRPEVEQAIEERFGLSNCSQYTKVKLCMYE
ncbi:MAG: glycosyltransferase family 39 protein [Chloroflexota bacterium]